MGVGAGGTIEAETWKLPSRRARERSARAAAWQGPAPAAAEGFGGTQAGLEGCEDHRSRAAGVGPGQAGGVGAGVLGTEPGAACQPPPTLRSPRPAPRWGSSQPLPEAPPPGTFCSTQVGLTEWARGGRGRA